MAETNDKLLCLKDSLYSILMATDNGEPGKELMIPDHVTANQKMGVGINSSVAKQGVQIFQFQSVVQHKVIHNVIDALKIIDSIPPIPIAVVIEQEEVIPTPLTLDQIIDDALQKEVGAFEFAKYVESLYVGRALEKYRNEKSSDVAKKLQISVSKLMQVRKKINS